MPAKTPQQWLELIDEGFAKQDLDGILALYDQEAVVMPEPGKPVKGHAAIREVMGGFLAMNGTFKTSSARAVENGPLATLYASWTFDAAGPDGPINMAGDATVVLSKKNDGWVAMIDDFWSQA